MFQQKTSIAIAAAVITCFAASTQLVAAQRSTSSSTVTYTASGTFASTPVSGSDLFKLAGQPFTITITASESLKPTKSGKTYAEYSKLKMTGTVTSGLLPTPIALSSGGTNLELALGNTSYDVFGLFVPVKVVGLQINITSKITMPTGTITTSTIGPFKGSVTLSPANATVTYSDTTGSTTLAINGSLTTTVK